MDTQRKTSILILVLRKHMKSQMVTNEGRRGISRNLFITRGVDAFQLKLKSVGTTLRQTQICKHFFAGQQAASSEDFLSTQQRTTYQFTHEQHLAP